MNRISTAAYRHWNASLVNIAQATNTSRSCKLTTASFISAQRKMSLSSAQNSASSGKFLSLDNINPNYVELEYAVRGPLVTRAGELEKELKEGAKKPFDHVIRANIGDCHAMGQKPITFLRQLLALAYDTTLFNSPNYPEDVKKRARIILDDCQGGSAGSYTDSAGIEVIRKQVASFIEKRDGIPSDWQNIYLTGGASPAIKQILALVRCETNGKKPGVMVPIPQYPLYSATLSEYDLARCSYYLNEDDNWSLEVSELERAYAEARKTCEPRALVVINPGNPTGQVLTHDNIVEVIKFAHKHKLLILSDEVYQANIWDPKSKFYAFKKVAHEMGSPYREMELVSFMTASKGYLGECGIRGGYMEIVNFDPKVKAMLTKTITASLCSTTAGQIAVSALVYPPEKGEPSYEQYIAEKEEVLCLLKERAELVYKAFNSFEGFKVNVVQGAMYAFPQIILPPKAIEAAKAKNMPPDTFYAFELLEATGICIVSGSGFGQKEGTYHFRTTILPQTEDLKIMLNKFKTFHAGFLKRYK